MPATPLTKLASELAGLRDRVARIERGGGLSRSSVETPAGTVAATDSLRVPRLELDLELSAGWAPFGNGWAGPRLVRSADGIVTLSGLVGTASVVTGNVLVLPEGCRPAANLLFLAACETTSTTSGTPGVARLNVLASGELQVSGYLSGKPDYLSLAGIHFPVS